MPVLFRFLRPPVAAWASSSRGLLQDSGVLNARILRLPPPVVKDYACPFPCRFRRFRQGLCLSFWSSFGLLSTSCRLGIVIAEAPAGFWGTERPYPTAPAAGRQGLCLSFWPLFWPLTGLRRHEPVSPVIGALGDSGGRAAPRELRGLREVTVSRAAVVVSRIKGLCLSFSGLFRLSFSGFQLPTADFNVQPSCFRLFPDTQIAFAVVIASPKLTSTRWSIRCPPIGVVIFHE